jgi:hypothetical protein
MKVKINLFVIVTLAKRIYVGYAMIYIEIIKQKN